MDEKTGVSNLDPGVEGSVTVMKSSSICESNSSLVPLATDILAITENKNNNSNNNNNNNNSSTDMRNQKTILSLRRSFPERTFSEHVSQDSRGFGWRHLSCDTHCEIFLQSLSCCRCVAIELYFKRLPTGGDNYSSVPLKRKQNSGP